MRDLVKFVLAMRPDRIVVGEVRGAEAFELSRAVNAGCGFLCTVHANSAAEGARRAGQRGAHGGRERHRAHRAQGLLGVARRRHPRRSRRHGQRRRRDAAPPGDGDRGGGPRLARRLHHRAALRARRRGRAAALDRRAPGSLATRLERGPATVRSTTCSPARSVSRELLRRARIGLLLRLVAAGSLGQPSRSDAGRTRRGRASRRSNCGSRRPASAVTPGSSGRIGRRRPGGARRRHFVTGTVLVAVGARDRGRVAPARVLRQPPTARLREVQAAWPDGLRDLVASIAAGRSLSGALVELAATGPRAAARRVRSFRVQRADARHRAPRSRSVEADWPIPTSDRVIEVLILASERGGQIVKEILEDLVAATTKDLKVLDEIDTEGLEMRINAARGARAAVVRARRADRARRPVPGLLPLERRIARACSSAAR